MEQSRQRPTRPRSETRDGASELRAVCGFGEHGGKVTTLTSVIEKVKIRGISCWARCTASEQFADLKETLLSNTFQVVPSLRFGFHQKNHMDIQLVIDALDVAYTSR